MPMWSDIAALAFCMAMVFAIGLCRMAAPSNPIEQAIDDRAQIEALAEWSARKNGQPDAPEAAE
jgi:hypothetical protein